MVIGGYPLWKPICETGDVAMLENQKVRRFAPEMDPLHMGMGWTAEDLEKPQIIIESTFSDSHPGSVEEALIFHTSLSPSVTNLGNFSINSLLRCHV